MRAETRQIAVSAANLGMAGTGRILVIQTVNLSTPSNRADPRLLPPRLISRCRAANIRDGANGSTRDERSPLGKGLHQLLIDLQPSHLFIWLEGR